MQHDPSLLLLEFLRNLATVTITLFIVLDPVGLTPFLYTVIAGKSSIQARHVIYRVTGSATVLLLFFTVTGTWVLRFFGVTLEDLQIGGGLLLVIISIQLVIQGYDTGEGEREQRSVSETPLISPLLIGPGAITAAVVLATGYGIGVTAAGAALAMFISLLVFLASGYLQKLIGRSGTDLIRRIFGILIVAVGISYMRVGLTTLITHR